MSKIIGSNGEDTATWWNSYHMHPNYPAMKLRIIGCVGTSRVFHVK
jgi:hypothetical protein